MLNKIKCFNNQFENSCVMLIQIIIKIVKAFQNKKNTTNITNTNLAKISFKTFLNAMII